MTATRRQAREWAIQMLTAADLNPPEDIQRFIEDHWAQHESLDHEDGGDGQKVRGKLKRFAEERVQGVLAEKDALDAKLGMLLEDWDVDRLGTVERTVLRMGLWELDNCPDIPGPVVINEAVDLVNWFSSPRSRTLVNGVLDRYAKNAVHRPVDR